MKVLCKRYDIDVDTSQKLNYPGEFLLPKEAKILKGIDFILYAGNAAYTHTWGAGTVNIPENILNNIDCKNKTLINDTTWTPGGNQIILKGNIAFSGIAGTLNMFINGKTKENIPVVDRMFFYEIDNINQIIDEEQKSIVDMSNDKIEHNFNSYLPLDIPINNHRIGFNYNSNENPAFSQFIISVVDWGIDGFFEPYLPIAKYKVFVYLKYTI